MGPQGRTADALIARLAGESHGVVTRAELLALGLSVAQVRRRLERGSLLAVHRGVYRVGHRALSVHASYLAAVRAGGPAAYAVGLAAAHLLDIRRGASPPPEVMTLTERHVPGVVTRRTRAHDPRDVTERHGIPVSTVPRTLVDLAGVLSGEELGRCCHEARVRHRLEPTAVEAVLDRRPASRGAATLRAILRGDEPTTLSSMERVFLSRLRSAGLPMPLTNVSAGRRWVDCRWPVEHLTVELISYRYHGSRHAWEKDLEGERQARGRGDRFRRYAYADVAEDPRFMLAELRGLLADPSRPD